MKICAFCGNAVDPDDPETYHQVTSWVNGPKLDGPKLREQTGDMAHRRCIELQLNGQAVDQPVLFDNDTIKVEEEEDDNCTCKFIPHKIGCPLYEPIS